MTTEQPAAPRKRTAMVIAGVVAVLIVGALGFALGLSSGGRGPVGSNATWKDLSYTLPSAWRTIERETGTGAGASLYLAPAPDEPDGLQLPAQARIQVIRWQKFEPRDFKEELQSQNPQTASKPTDVRYGLGGKLRGVELRYVRNADDEPDVVVVQAIVRAGSADGPVFQLQLMVPASQESKYAATWRAFRESLEVK